MLIAGVAVIVLTFLPLVPAFLGLVLNIAELQTYHWLLLMTLPVGVPLGVLGLLCAAVLWMLSKRRVK